MSHVLLVSDEKNLINQAELLAIELEKNGHFVTYSPTSHPLRLFSKNFDTVHLLANTLPLQPKQLIFALTAQALGYAVILSLFGDAKFNRIERWQLRAVDGLTAYCLHQYNKLKFFNKNKMIFTGLFESEKIEPTTATQLEKVIVFPIINSVDELPLKINLTQTAFIVDASLASSNLKKQIKREWTTWKKDHPQNEKALLSTQWKTVENIAKDQGLVLVTSHLNLNALQTLEFYHRAIQNQAIWIPNKDQASAFSNLWHKLESRLIVGDEFTFIDGFHYGLSPFTFTFSELNEIKSNELTRLYSRVQNEKSSAANRLSDNMTG